MPDDSDREARRPRHDWLRALGGRGALLAVAIRGLWWGALALWLVAARELFAGGTLDPDAGVRSFAIGAAMCAIAVVATRAARVRVMSWALGSLHGCSAVVLWLAAS